MSEIIEMSTEAHSTLDKYKDAKKSYDEFKKLRKQLGKPLREFINPEGIEKDLAGEDFYTLLDELKKKRV